MPHKLMVLAAAKVQLAAHVELQGLDGAACDSHLLAPKNEGNHLDYYNSPAPAGHGSRFNNSRMTSRVKEWVPQGQP